jgi:succinate dehydrogenase / fumarate reductase, cytochrome b subunit
MSATRSRPLSPHLQVYRWQISMVLSILHRMTGVALFFGTLLWVWWLVAAAVGEDEFETARWFIGTWLGQILLLGWTWALFYHLANGIRHLFWDIGKGYEIGTMTASGWAAVLSSFALTAAAWVAGYVVWME